jgi:hypothetical protein
MNKFQIGDRVKWNTKSGTREFDVVDVWEDSEPKQLLVTDTEHVTLTCNIALARDCELISRDPEYKPKEYVREVRKVEPIIKITHTPEGV